MLSEMIPETSLLTYYIVTKSFLVLYLIVPKYI